MITYKIKRIKKFKKKKKEVLRFKKKLEARFQRERARGAKGLEVRLGLERVQRKRGQARGEVHREILIQIN